MATLNEAELKKTVKLFQENDRNATKTAKAMGLPRTTVQSRIREADTRGLLPEAPSYLESDLEMPDLPSSELPEEELIEQACARFESHFTAKQARRWMEIKIKSNKPIGIAFVGDPHLDNNGCNWPLLRRDIQILKETEGLFAVNLGDQVDNWVGRLMKLYADQEMSKKQSWKLAKYFMREAGIKWLCHILGNHDAWNDGPYLIKANAAPVVPVEDWQSRFQLVFPNGRRIKIHAAHDFPGHSIWNDLHGPKKASMLSEEADIFVCGHKHTWAIQEYENALRGYVCHLIRARGYKFIDSYADQLGFGSQKYGATVTAIIDPSVDGPSRIRCLPDLEEAAEFLTWKRARA